MKVRTLVSLVALWAAPVMAGEPAPPSAEPEISVEGVSFAGAGDWTLHGKLYRAVRTGADRAPSPAAICHPMLGRTMDTHEPLARQLAAAGITALVYDPRGHGKSSVGEDGKPRPAYDTFMGETEKDLAFWSGLPDDLAKARAFLAARTDVDGKRIALVGASVGANATLLESTRSKPAAAVLLSPGEDFRGLKALERAPRLECALMVVMADKDPVSGMAPAKVYAAAERSSSRVLKRFNSDRHGTDLFVLKPELAGEIADWLAQKMQPQPRVEATTEAAAPPAGK